MVLWFLGHRPLCSAAPIADGGDAAFTGPLSGSDLALAAGASGAALLTAALREPARPPQPPREPRGASSAFEYALRHPRTGNGQLDASSVELLVDDAVGALGGLATARTRDPLDCSASSPSFFGLPGAACANRIREGLRDRVRLFGAPTESLPPAGSCLSSVLGSQNTVNPDPVSTVRPYLAEKLKVVSSEHRTVDLLPLLTGDALAYAIDPQLILKGDLDVDPADRPQLYTDPALQDRKGLLALVHMLLHRGLVVARLTRIATVGIFTVFKKGDLLRLVFDCRLSNLFCHKPPHSHLSTVGAVASIRLPPVTPSGGCFTASDPPHSRFDSELGDHDTLHGRPFVGSIVAVDLKDSFYLFIFYALSGLFCFEHAFSAGELGVDRYIDDHGQWQPCDPLTTLWVALCTLPMGWSWALYFCHHICTRGLLRAAACFGLAEESAQQLLVLAGRPGPRVAPGRPALAPYVDNFNAVCWDPDDARQYLHSLTSVLDFWRLTYRVENDGGAVWATVGVTLDVSRRLVYAKPERMWRLRGATLDLRAQGRCSGAVMRTIIGHLGFLSMVFKPFLSVFDHVYRFMVDNDDRVGVFSAHVLAELRCAAALIPVLVSSLASDFSEIAYTSDSSLKGYAIHIGRFAAAELEELGVVRERWKFRDFRPLRGPLPAEQLATGMGTIGPFERWADGQLTLQDHRTQAARERRERLPRAMRSLPEGDHRDPAHFLEDVDLGGISDAPAVCDVGGGLFGAVSVPPLPDFVVDPSRWERLLVGAWRQSGRIHNLEARTSLVALSHAAGTPELWGKQVLCIGDNEAEILATENGRAKDRELNSVCRRAASMQCCTGIAYRRRHVESHRNVTDKDSRLADDGVLAPGQHFVGQHLDRYLSTRRRGSCRSPPFLRPPGAAILELFAGGGALSASLIDDGIRVAQPVDLAYGLEFDVLDPRVQRAILGWVDSGLLAGVWVSVPSSFDRLPHYGALDAAQRQTHRQRLLRFCVRLVRGCRAHGVRVAVENPLFFAIVDLSRLALRPCELRLPDV